MTTPVGHSLFGVIVYLFASRGSRKGLLLFALLMTAAFLPDFDYFPVLWGDLKLANLNHQWFTHSLLFVFVSGLALAIVGKWLQLGSIAKLYLFIVAIMLSHLLLDYLTYDGREPKGILLLWPFSDQRFNSPVSVFGGVAKGSFSDLFSLHNLGVVGGELLIVGVPALLLWFYLRRTVR